MFTELSALPKLSSYDVSLQFCADWLYPVKSGCLSGAASANAASLMQFSYTALMAGYLDMSMLYLLIAFQTCMPQAILRLQTYLQSTGFTYDVRRKACSCGHGRHTSGWKCLCRGPMLHVSIIMACHQDRDRHLRSMMSYHYPGTYLHVLPVQSMLTKLSPVELSSSPPL